MDFQQWLQDTVSQGLQARWDAEYLEKFNVARQTPAQPVGAGGAAAQLPVKAAPMVSPVVLIGGVALLAAGLYFVMRGD
jgi:hypothetical protein